jgi:hypothetical protein
VCKNYTGEYVSVANKGDKDAVFKRRMKKYLDLGGV